ncbi:MAG: hypothetical protein MZV49_19260 [Rhodopseudomonas palustris]|nr:hypothetical protein [Rhodopseudomonas palustris]
MRAMTAFSQRTNRNRTSGDTELFHIESYARRSEQRHETSDARRIF